MQIIRLSILSILLTLIVVGCGKRLNKQKSKSKLEPVALEMEKLLQEDLNPVSFRDSSKEVHRKMYSLDHVSFGHDVETAYLLMEASEALKIKDDKRTMVIGKKMVDNALTYGWDEKSAGVFDAGYFYKNEDTITILRDSKNWWAQAETMNTLLIMSYLFPDDPLEYEKRFDEQWQFIKDYLIDWENGGWYESALDKEPPKENREKISYMERQLSYSQVISELH